MSDLPCTARVQKAYAAIVELASLTFYDCVMAGKYSHIRNVLEKMLNIYMVYVDFHVQSILPFSCETDRCKGIGN